MQKMLLLMEQMNQKIEQTPLTGSKQVHLQLVVLELVGRMRCEVRVIV